MRLCQAKATQNFTAGKGWKISVLLMFVAVLNNRQAADGIVPADCG